MRAVLGSDVINSSRLETVHILDIHELTLSNEFFTNQDIFLNMKITFSKLTLLLKVEFDVIFISIYLNIDI